MAHAGTPRDLATRPATSGSSGHAGIWQALLVVAITVAVVLGTSFVVGSKASTGTPLTDRSYDQIESQRGAANFSVLAGDRSYDQIESQRGALGVPDLPGDRSFDKIQSEHGTGNFTDLPGDRSFDKIQSENR